MQPAIFTTRMQFVVILILGIFWSLNVISALAGEAPAQAPTSDTVRFEFREPRLAAYRVERPDLSAASTRKNLPSEWLKAWPERTSAEPIELGNRIAVEVKTAEDLPILIQDRPLQLSRTLTSTLFILEAPDTWTALEEAAALAADDRVASSYPIARRPKQLYANYSSKPNDPYFDLDTPDTGGQWYLENRDAGGTPIGVDLNVRAAWPISRGHRVMIAVADDGIEVDHPDLLARTQGAAHFNFYTSETNGLPAGPMAHHGTAVAGLAAATSNNKTGISGVAPAASVASWVLFNHRDQLLLSEEQLMDMFQYKSNVVSVQNHSWGKGLGDEQLRFSSIENLGISNAVTFGRSGRGVVLVRAAGNGRSIAQNVNDDAYPSDPRVIAVAAVRRDGRVARYSSPGACVLVAAPSGDMDDVFNPCITNSPNLLTTDRQGLAGYNANVYTNDLANYVFGAAGFSGTSAAAPQISGVVALILGANPNLTYRDVQQVLIHSSRHFDLADPDVKTNGAGFRVSHNVGFGVPDAGQAVFLARKWTNRPPLTNITYQATNSVEIPDEGLRVVVRGTNVPVNLRSIVALPSTGLYPDVSTALLPLVDVGQATEGLTRNLTGRAALIQRGENYFCEKLSLAATVGASFAIVYNNRDVTAREIMSADFSSIPAVFINQIDGEALRDYLQADPSARAQLRITSASYTFTVKQTLLCEHVALRIDTDHTARSDVRITLVSPRGTRSVLQTLNKDEAPGPVDWTYHSTQHFYEGSAGTWTVAISDLDENGTGSVKDVSLIISGVPIADKDSDGLDDLWEMNNLNTLAFGPLDDPDDDGYINSREQIMGTKPNVSDIGFKLDISLWSEQLARLSWPSTTNVFYEIRTGRLPAAPSNLVTNLPGRFPQTEWFIPYTDLLHQFYRVEAISLATPAR
jgi:subtilisin family serine protease